jgi:hypothetical protein
MAYTKYSLTPANNNAAPPDGAPEGMLPSAVNDTMRDMMSQIRDVGDGIRGGTYTMTAPVITGGSITGVALSGNTLTNPVITGGSINNTPIGASTANTGAFTNLAYTGTLTGGTGVVNLGSGQFYKDASGNVGIGTSSPAGRLDVVSSGDVNLFVRSTGDAAAVLYLRGNGSNSAYNGIVSTNTATSTQQWKIGNIADSQTLAFFTGTSERMRIDSSGNVVVGGTSAILSAAGRGNITVNGSSSAIYTLGIGGTERGYLYVDGSSVALSSSTTIPLVFQTNGSERMAINSSGNVGIGTSSPAAKLQVSGGNIRLDNNQGLEFGGANNYIYGNETTDFIALATNGNERMRIDSSGNLLVGTTNNPTSSKLNVAGKVMVANNNVSNSAGNEYFFVDSGDRYIVFHGTSLSSGAVHFYFQNPNGLVGSIETNGSSTSYVTSSDYRLKENIAPMTGALDVVQQLKPVTYNWKVDGSSGQGFIAHELQAVVPECVTGEKDAVDAEGKPVYQGIDTSFLVATLTASIQELKAIVDAQAARIAALESN